MLLVGKQRGSVPARQSPSIARQWVKARRLFFGQFKKSAMAGDTQAVSPTGWIGADSASLYDFALHQHVYSLLHCPNNAAESGIAAIRRLEYAPSCARGSRHGCFSGSPGFGELIGRMMALQGCDGQQASIALCATVADGPLRSAIARRTGGSSSKSRVLRSSWSCIA